MRIYRQNMKYVLTHMLKNYIIHQQRTTIIFDISENIFVVGLVMKTKASKILFISSYSST